MDTKTVNLATGDQVHYTWYGAAGEVLQSHTHTAPRNQTASGTIDRLPNDELNIYFKVRNVI